MIRVQIKTSLNAPAKLNANDVVVDTALSLTWDVRRDMEHVDSCEQLADFDDFFWQIFPVNFTISKDSKLLPSVITISIASKRTHPNYFTQEDKVRKGSPFAKSMRLRQQ